MPVVGEKANFLDLEPTTNEKVDKDTFQGFKKAQAANNVKEAETIPVKEVKPLL